MDIELQRHIFMGFFRASIVGYGGGPSSIPLVHKEVVNKYEWMTDTEFSDVLAIANTLPGPIATKMSGYIGYRVGGIIGLLNALIATVMPTVILMIILIGFLANHRDSPIVEGMTQAVAPVVGVMLFILAFNFFKNAKSNLGWGLAIILAVVGLVALQILGIHPALLVGLLLVYGLLTKQKIGKN